MFLLTLISLVAAVSDPSCNSAYCSQCVLDQPDFCASCIDGYILRGETCIHKHDLHCLGSANGVCTQCEEGYEWDPIDRQCIPGDDGCDKLGEDGISCLSCKIGYMQEVDGTCTKCSNNPYCRSFNGACDRCTDCGTSYGLANGICNKTVPHCTLYSENKCLDCALGYYLYQQTCKRGPIENCQKYSYDEEAKTYTCRQCISTFLFDSETQTCLFEKDYITPGCEKMLSKTQCLYCQKNYHMNASAVCELCPTGCSSCTVKDVCEECYDGYKLVDGKCEEKKLGPYQCNTVAQSESACTESNDLCVYEVVNDQKYCTYKGLNCTKHDENYKCVECNLGYKLDPNRQEACLPTIEGCIKYGEHNSVVKCISCDSNGYYMKQDFTCGKCGDMCLDGKCQHTATNCDAYQCDDFACVKCSASKDTCEMCPHGVAVGKDGWCGSDTCAEYLETGECNYCAQYSKEQVYDEALGMYVPKNYYFYIPSEEGHCGEFVPPEEPDKPVDPDDPHHPTNNDDNNDDDLTWLYYILGVIGVLILLGLIAGLIALIAWLIQKRLHRNSEYHILD